MTLIVYFTTGAHFPRMRTAVYFVVGSWCLGAFILGSAYNSLLISYILGSNAKPLVDSALELVQKSNVHLIVDKGRGTELFLTVTIIQMKLIIKERTIKIFVFLCNFLRLLNRGFTNNWEINCERSRNPIVQRDKSALIS